ncbi:nitrogenase iron-molybdenum cofactor biosynthesis protein NifN [Vibrio ulleungensis]|uniref:Nitrogenase iron-molybdenum cofactor biosynthesis protein NifN n=1 Tax=Vibrio ulleungensis TaxID=2807619 RepID=A0ABS2HG00_9VIBR|nr:nitrogenase iron-molybdenum cofactor biosynthesis protein NifN [Vibrio ulleungensis]MBM7035586.1 nitrogenase iron-molybdenum cofactor biosynthesis protein NifN [Vibrio ulleungensis]
MSKLIKQRVPLATQPLKTSAATGAAVAALGFRETIPLLHGAQGCAAFSKVFLISHFREPIPIQNTAIDHISAVMGGDENLFDALLLLCEKHSPELVAVMTTGLTEMQGTDLARVIVEFKKAHPHFTSTHIVPMNTPDFSGSMQTGFAHAVDRVVRQIVKPPVRHQSEKKQLTVLCSVGLSGADIETLKRYVEAFDLKAVFVPDISLSLDGHMGSEEFVSTSMGGTSLQEVEQISNSAATIVVGESMMPTARWLYKRFSIPIIESQMCMGIDQTDNLIMALAELSDKPVPQWITLQRKRLQDAMVDTHFFLSSSRMSLGLEPDLALGYSALLHSVGVDIERLVTTIDTSGVKTIEAKTLMVGDLSMLAQVGDEVDAIISNSHAANIYEPIVPVLRAGFPCHDQFGNMDIKQIGYEGSRERLFALANKVMHNQHTVSPHQSIYRFNAEQVIPTSQRRGSALC